jgi:hypothetical protein
VKLYRASNNARLDRFGGLERRCKRARKKMKIGLEREPVSCRNMILTLWFNDDKMIPVMCLFFREVIFNPSNALYYKVKGQAQSV